MRWPLKTLPHHSQEGPRTADGYDHDNLGMSLTEVLNNPQRKMGHAFVLKMLLTKDAALKHLHLRD